ncbi:hypothetical protein DFH09DRAFT_82482 [Mycena vulgaris]|nr:hypothetical protein DFH09DRAFT_82482 [Mycena vulgaris]
MDSQRTLTPSVPISLVFDTNSMLAATLSLDARPAYTIATPPAGSPTELRAADTGALLARISCRALLPDTICFPSLNGGKAMRVSKWLKRCALPDGLEAHAITTDVGKFFLTRDLAHRLALFAEHDLEHPVAHWRGPAPGRPPTLVLYPGTEDFHAQIIAAFALQELKIRMWEKADAALTPVGYAAILDTTPLAMFSRV